MLKFALNVLRNWVAWEVDNAPGQANCEVEVAAVAMIASVASCLVFLQC